MLNIKVERQSQLADTGLKTHQNLDNYQIGAARTTIRNILLLSNRKSMLELHEKSSGYSLELDLA